MEIAAGYKRWLFNVTEDETMVQYAQHYDLFIIRQCNNRLVLCICHMNRFEAEPLTYFRCDLFFVL